MSSKMFIHSRAIANEAKLKIFFFPHSGSGPSSYLQWHKELADFEVIGIQYPGRGTSLDEEPCSTISELVQALLNEGELELTGRFVFFGHSLGAMIAYELACALQKLELNQPEALFLSALPAPPYDDHQYKNRKVTLEDLLTMVASFSPDLLPYLEEDPELQDLFLSTLVADVGMLGRYQFVGHPKLSCPIHAFGGISDSVTSETIQKWQDFTANHFTLDLFQGAHFYFMDQAGQQPQDFFNCFRSYLASIANLNLTSLNRMTPMIDIWAIKYQDCEKQISLKAFLQSLLSHEEIVRLEAFHSLELQNRFLIRHGILRLLLGKALGLAADEILFSIDTFGKPFIKGHSLKFNMSSSGEYFIIALGRAVDLGVDIERIHPLADANEIAKSLFSQEECQAIEMTSPEMFFRIWSEKESFVKATGRGLGDEIRNYTMTCVSKSDFILFENQKWKQVNPKYLPTIKEYSISLCHEDKFAELSINYQIVEALEDLQFLSLPNLNLGEAL